MADSTIPLSGHRTPEWELLLHCARARVDAAGAARIAALVGGDLDWNRVLTLALDHGVGALLHAALDHVEASGVPQEVRRTLEQRFFEGAARNLRITGQLLDVMASLAAHGIDALTFKGPALCLQAYGSLAFRVFADVDVLVRRADVHRAWRVLAADGYRLPFWYRRLIDGVYPPAEYHYAFIPIGEGGGRVAVEVHAEPFMWYFDVPWETEDLLRGAVPVVATGSTLRTLSHDDTLLFLAVHGATHGWRKLEHVSSIAALMTDRSADDWNAIVSRAGQIRATRMLLVAALLASSLMGASVPTALRPAIEADRAAAVLASRFADRLLRDRGPIRLALDRLATHVAVRQRWRDKARYLMRSVVNLAFMLSVWLWPSARRSGTAADGPSR